MKYLLIELVIGLLLGWWMYNDAKKRSLKNPSVWIWVGLLFNVLGLLTYCYWHIWSNKKAEQ